MSDSGVDYASSTSLGIYCSWVFVFLSTCVLGLYKEFNTSKIHWVDHIFRVDHENFQLGSGVRSKIHNGAIMGWPCYNLKQAGFMISKIVAISSLKQPYKSIPCTFFYFIIKRDFSLNIW